jgi:hypothetical protein
MERKKIHIWNPEHCRKRTCRRKKGSIMPKERKQFCYRWYLCNRMSRIKSRDAELKTDLFEKKNLLYIYLDWRRKKINRKRGCGRFTITIFYDGVLSQVKKKKKKKNGATQKIGDQCEVLNKCSRIREERKKYV